MHFTLKGATAIVGAALFLSITAAGQAATQVLLGVTGDWTPGTGMTAVNTDSTSTLALGSSLVTYEGTFAEAIIGPGESVAIALGTVSADTLIPMERNNFRGASLALTLTVQDPAGAPPEVLAADVSGEVAIFDGQVDLGWTAPQTAEFDLGANTLTVTVEALTSAPGGFGPVDINAVLSMSGTGSGASGDLDGDGLVTMVDAIFAMRIAAGLDAAEATEPGAADMNNDGFIRLEDAGAICRAAA